MQKKVRGSHNSSTIDLLMEAVKTSSKLTQASAGLLQTEAKTKSSESRNGQGMSKSDVQMKWTGV
jgi:hypothetical protein